MTTGTRVRELEEALWRMMVAVESLEGTPLQYHIGMDLAEALKEAKRLLIPESAAVQLAKIKTRLMELEGNNGAEPAATSVTASENTK